MIHTLGVGERRGQRTFGIGSRKRYDAIRRFILNTIKQRQGQDVYFTTLFDLYALSDDFPGREGTTLNPGVPESYVRALETAFAKDIDHFRFIPYLQLYEYETLLFADPEAFRIAFENCDDGVGQLKAIAASYPSVEQINDGPETAPSKRIIALIPQYDGRKSSAGPDIAASIGIARIRERCPHFHHWLETLENLAWPAEAT
jgi:hypothetical protein